MATGSRRLLRELLRDVSRSFYLTLRVLPGAVRDQVGLAYLLARTTDTIADTDAVPVEQRLKVLDQFRQRILHPGAETPDLSTVAGQQAKAGERELLRRFSEAVAVLESFTMDDQRDIRFVLSTITSGQELDLRRFANSSAAHITALETDADLDDYTYRVAGCVGEFWTRICRRGVFPNAELDGVQLIANGIRFGKGLQLVNVLRDLPADLRNGRCYMPSSALAGAGLAPSDLLDQRNEARLRPVFNKYLDLASAHLSAGWAYTTALPFRCVRLRLACSWPILIGVGTISRLRTSALLDSAQPVKLSRSEVRSLILRSVALYPMRAAWERQARADLPT